ncbi:MAG: SDR family oxidoreductase [bacterium]|nr:SDR family oxidoreductase [bacterium]
MIPYVPKDALVDRVAIITGAGAGIGLATARAFLAAGARVVMTDVDGPRLSAAVSPLEAGDRVVCLEGDVSKAGAPGRAFDAAEEKFGAVDILVNNAGIMGPVAPIESMDPAGWRETLEVNLTAPFLWTAEFLRRLPAEIPEDRNVCVIHISSVSGKKPLVHRAPYCAAKAGIIGLTRQMALELGPRGIRVNAICPGAVSGERIERILKGRAEASGRTLEEERAYTLAETPLGAFIDPADIAAASVFPASDAARLITGEDMNVNGGRVMY